MHPDEANEIWLYTGLNFGQSFAIDFTDLSELILQNLNLAFNSIFVIVFGLIYKIGL